MASIATQVTSLKRPNSFRHQVARKVAAGSISMWGMLALCPLHAEVSSQTLCFESMGKQPVGVLLQSYRDGALDLDIGALVRYRNAKRMIPLVYVGTIAAEGDPQGYQTQWLEVVNEKISGRYSLIKPGSATIEAAYLVYENLHTGRKTRFAPRQTLAGSCQLQPEGSHKNKSCLSLIYTIFNYF